VLTSSEMFCEPCRALRQSRRCLVILEGELPGGSSRMRFGAKLVARALRPPHRVLHTRQDWPSATEVLQIDLRSSASQIISAEWHRYESLFGARVRDELPHASCVEVGGRTFRENNAVQVAGLDRICLYL